LAGGAPAAALRAPGRHARPPSRPGRRYAVRFGRTRQALTDGYREKPGMAARPVACRPHPAL